MFVLCIKHTHKLIKDLSRLCPLTSAWTATIHITHLLTTKKITFIKYENIMLKSVFLLLLFPLSIEPCRFFFMISMYEYKHFLTSVNSRGKVHVKFRKGRKKPIFAHLTEQRQMPSNKAHLRVEFSLLIINAEFQNKGQSKVTRSPEKQGGGPTRL